MKRVLLLPLALLCACTPEPPPAAPAPPPAPAAAEVGQRDRTARAGPAPELTTAAFQRFATSRRKEVRRCYDAALSADATVRGKMRLRLTIQPSGAVDEVEVSSTSFRDPAVPRCVAAVVRSWRTPFRPEEPVGIDYPFSFAPGR